MDTKPKTFDYVRRLEDNGFTSQQAFALVEAMEGILGTPLSEAVFDAKMSVFDAKMEAANTKTEASKDLILGKLNEFSIGMKAFTDKTELRQEAFESHIKAIISNGRLWMIGGVLTAVVTIIGTVIGVAVRLVFWGPL